MRSVFKTFTIAVVTAGIFLMSGSCGNRGQDSNVGSIQVRLLQPTGASCTYNIAPATLTTMTDIQQLKGTVGSVLTSDQDLSLHPEVMQTGVGFKPVDVNFAYSDGEYIPTDYNSLVAASLYYAVERGYLQYAKLDPSADMLKAVPGFGDLTTIVHQAVQSDSGSMVTDNAQFTPLVFGPVERYFILSFPVKDQSLLAPAENLGVMVHEYTHLIFNHLFYDAGSARGLSIGTTKPTQNTLDAWNEGMADYGGYLATKDPTYFECSYPSSNRNLAQSKTLTDPVRAMLEQGGDAFDPHDGGAVWAAINFEIGNTIGHDLNGSLMVKLMSSILDCSGASRSGQFNIDFHDIAACHAQLASASARPVILQTYNKYLGSYGSLR